MVFEEFARENIKKVRGNLKGVMPICVWEMGLSEKGPNDIINRPDFSFSFAILGGGVRARKTKMHAMLVAKLLELGVCILLSIVTLKLFNFSFKLGGNVIRENGKHGEYV